MQAKSVIYFLLLLASISYYTAFAAARTDIPCDSWLDCPSDGWYCNGDTREYRMYWCAYYLGKCVYDVLESENCSDYDGCLCLDEGYWECRDYYCENGACKYRVTSSGFCCPVHEYCKNNDVWVKYEKCVDGHCVSYNDKLEIDCDSLCGWRYEKNGTWCYYTDCRCVPTGECSAKCIGNLVCCNTCWYDPEHNEWEDELRCNGNIIEYRRCGEFDNDPCTDWSDWNVKENCDDYDGFDLNGCYWDYYCVEPSPGYAECDKKLVCCNECGLTDVTLVEYACFDDNLMQRECRPDIDPDPCNEWSEWTLVENCNNYDGWYCRTQTIREYRDYYCSNETASCEYRVTSSEDCSKKRTYDSDGDNPKVRGYIKDYIACSNGNCTYNIYWDKCADNIHVIEYLSSGASYTTKTYDCRLVSSEDSDGDNPLVKGYVKDYESCSNGACVPVLRWDYCRADGTLVEFLANGSTFATKDYNCDSYDSVSVSGTVCSWKDYGCSDGACALLEEYSFDCAQLNRVEGDRAYTYSPNCKAGCRESECCSESVVVCDQSNECKELEVGGVMYKCVKTSSGWIWTSEKELREVCGDGYDNDCDGKVDWDDLDCESSAKWDLILSCSVQDGILQARVKILMNGKEKPEKCDEVVGKLTIGSREESVSFDDCSFEKDINNSQFVLVVNWSDPSGEAHTASCQRTVTAAVPENGIITVLTVVLLFALLTR